MNWRRSEKHVTMTGGVAQVEEHLPSKHNALSSKSRTIKEERKGGMEGKEGRE
jgi:hypothetical protein